MRNAVLFTAVAAFLLTGCSSMQVYVDYDKEADFDALQTFMFKDSGKESMVGSSPLLHSRLISTIEEQFEAAGLEKVDSNPDIYVTYYTSTKEEFRADTTSFGYGYPSPWHSYGYGYGGWGYGYGGTTGSTRVTSYDVGTLVVDAWSAETESLLWRGVASDVVEDNPEKASKQLEHAIAKMVAESEKKM